MTSDPFLSICCVTYNHASYITNALDGFLTQRVDFPIEIVIHDDCSTDGTKDIVRQFRDRYPGLVTAILQTENQWSKGIKVSPITFERARGKYIAMCEGDDCWTDPTKLQRQVDFLENNPGFSVCYHRVESNVQLLNQNGDSDYEFSFADSLTGKHGATLSMVFRTSDRLRELFDLTTKDVPMGDWPLECLLTINNSGYFMDRTMGFYNQLTTGATATRLRSQGTYFDSRVRFFTSLLSHAPMSMAQRNLVQQMIVLHQIAHRNSQLNRTFRGAVLQAQLRAFLGQVHLYGVDRDYQYSYNKQLKRTIDIILRKSSHWLGAKIGLGAKGG